MKTDTVRQTAAFTARNIKLFFKDKGTLVSAFISPIIILVLYVLFLDSVLKDTFTMNLPEGFKLSDKLMNGYIAAYEISSILAVCCVTVAFIANMAMVDDRISGARNDLNVTPVKGRILILGYYFSTALVTVSICYIAMAVGFVYIAIMGWNMTVTEVFAAMLDVLLSSLFGTALSSVVCFFLKSKGAIAAVSTIVSSVYGFICGAYYPIAQFSSGMANTVMCLPGTYCTGLLRTHFMSGFKTPFLDAGIPPDVVDGILNGLDAKLYFFGSAVPAWAMYLAVACSVAALIAVFAAINVIAEKRRVRTKA